MKKIIFIIIIIMFCLFLYAKYIEVGMLSIHEHTITSSKIPDGFDGLKIIHFSDVYYKDSNDLEMIKKVTNLINKQNPDVVVFTGDFSNKKINKKEKNKIIKELQSISADYKYMIQGDNDTDISSEILINSGFSSLDKNSTYIFNNDNEPILIAGGKNLLEEDLLHDEEIDYNFIITLLHMPDDVDKLDYNTDLVLAGHSLGGQIKVPFFGGIIRENGAKKYHDSYHQKGNTEIYISSGIGLGNLKLRLFNKPSINLYRLNTKK